jgi:hypothetical protein
MAIVPLRAVFRSALANPSAGLNRTKAGPDRRFPYASVLQEAEHRNAAMRPSPPRASPLRGAHAPLQLCHARIRREALRPGRFLMRLRPTIARPPNGPRWACWHAPCYSFHQKNTLNQTQSERRALIAARRGETTGIRRRGAIFRHPTLIWRAGGGGVREERQLCGLVWPGPLIRAAPKSGSHIVKRTRNGHSKSHYMFALMVRVSRLAKGRPALRRHRSRTREALINAWATCLTHTLRNGRWA